MTDYSLPLWVSVNSSLPTIGQIVLVVAQEWGHPPSYAVCKFWTNGRDHRFYVDNAYHGDPPHEVGEVVTHWMPVPPAPVTEWSKRK